ncbi:MAG: M20/M25/M40 family metallo-hydrolase [Acidimicrobiales bacterium]
MSTTNSVALLDSLRGAASHYRAAVIERLRELVECESPSGDVALLNVTRDRLRERWEALGLDVVLVNGDRGDHVVGTLRAEVACPGGHVLFLSHYDTVWSSGELLEQPFVVHDDIAHGPGTFDMKGGIVALETAFALLSERGLQPCREIRVVSIADEEVSSVDGRRVVDAESRGATCVFGLEPPNADGGFKNARRGVARVRLGVTGQAAHAGLDASKGVSAVDELVDQLMDLRAALPDARDAACNVGRIDGGTRANVVAGEAHAEIGLRFAKKSTEDSLFAALHSLTPHRDGASVEVQVLSQRPAWDVLETTWLTDHVLEISTALGGPSTAAPAGGAGDTNFTGAAGIATLDGLGPRGANAHAQGECVWISSILQRAELLAALMCHPLPVNVT